MSQLVSIETQPVKTIPTKKGLPLLGILPEIFGKDPYEYFKNIMLEHGDFVRLNLSLQPVYLVSSPDYLQHILRDNHKNYRKPDMFYGSAREVVGNGLVTSDGDYWLRQRRMIQPHLHRKQLAQLFTDMVESIQEALVRWQPLAASGQEIEFNEEISGVTMNVIMSTMFGKDALSQAEIEETGHYTKRMIDYVGRSMYTSFIPKWVPLPERVQFKKDLAVFYEVAQRIIAQCKQNKNTSASLIQMLLSTVDEETSHQMNDQQLFDEVATIFLAGYETTATVLTWLGVVMDKHPDVALKLYKEVDEVLGSRVPTFEDIPRLTYARQVFMEIMRMYTVVPLLPRALIEADQIGPYQLPANALVLVFYHGVHHNPQVWEEPEKFIPERFANTHAPHHHPFGYVPFSGGPRKCAGDEFAMMEGPLIMAMLLQKYRLHITANQTYETRVATTMRPVHGVKMTLSER